MEPRSRRRRVDDFRASLVARSEDEGVSPSVLLGYLLYLENRSGGELARKVPKNTYLGRFWPFPGMKWAKNAIFGPNLAVFGPKFLFSTGESKSFGTLIMDKSPRHLVCIVFGRAWDQMGKKCRYLANNDSFRPNLAVFGP